MAGIGHQPHRSPALGLALAFGLALVLAWLLALVAAGDARAAKPFAFGVAAGEITARSGKVWTRSPRTGRVQATIALDRGFRKVVGRKSLRAKKANDKTVQTTFRRLRSARKYWYRFCIGKGGGRVCSEAGRFKTAPGASSNRRVEFAFTGDTDGTPLPAAARKPFFGSFEAFRAMRREGNDFNINLGDTIYSDSGVGGGPPALSVREKWGKYKQNLGQRNLRKLRGSAGIYTHWDDHEFINDFSIPEHGRKLYKDGVRAFRDYAPVGYSEKNGLYRSFRWGKNAELFFLDERSFRDAKASANGTCDNPATGAPDLAPTAPSGTRATFALLIPSFVQAVSQACKNAINDPGRSLLGERQLRRFLKAVAASKARWKVIMSEMPIQQFYALPYDRWEGYAYERVKLLKELEKAGVKRLVFLSTDTHAAFANVVRQRTLAGDVAPSNAPASATDSPYQEYIIGPVATNTLWAEIDGVTGAEGNGKLISQVFFKPPPPAGVGMFCAQGDRNSYAQVSVSKKKLKIAYKDEDGGTISDVDGAPCGPYVLTG